MGVGSAFGGWGAGGRRKPHNKLQQTLKKMLTYNIFSISYFLSAIKSSNVSSTSAEYSMPPLSLKLDIYAFILFLWVFSNSAK